MAAAEFLGHGPRVVLGIIVDDEHFPRDRLRQLGSRHTFQSYTQTLRAVIGAQDYAAIHRSTQDSVPPQTGSSHNRIPPPQFGDFSSGLPDAALAEESALWIDGHQPIGDFQRQQPESQIENADVTPGNAQNR